MGFFSRSSHKPGRSVSSPRTGVPRRDVPLSAAARVPPEVWARIISRVLDLRGSALGRQLEAQSLLRVSRAVHDGYLLSNAVAERVVRSKQGAASLAKQLARDPAQAARVTDLYLDCAITKKKEIELLRVLAPSLKVLVWSPRGTDTLDLIVDHAFADALAGLVRLEEFRYAGRAAMCLPLTKVRAILAGWTELRVADAWRLDFFAPPIEAVPPSEWRFPTKLVGLDVAVPNAHALEMFATNAGNSSATLRHVGLELSDSLDPAQVSAAFAPVAASLTSFAALSLNPDASNTPAHGAVLAAALRPLTRLRVLSLPAVALDHRKVREAVMEMKKLRRLELTSRAAAPNFNGYHLDDVVEATGVGDVVTPRGWYGEERGGARISREWF